MTEIQRETTYSVVVPIYNEEATLPEFTRRLVSVLKDHGDYEVLFVNDGSTDRSEELIELFCHENSSIKLLSFSRNFGHQEAISAGLAFSSGAAVAVMDGDLQDPPEVLPEFFSKWKEGYEVVYAIRRRRKENMFKRLAYFCFYRILTAFADVNIPLDSGDFSVMDRQIVDKLNELPERNRFVRGIRAWLGYRQIGLEYERQERFSGKTKYTFTKLSNLAYNGLISFSRRPLIVATKLGILITSIAFLTIFIIIWRKLFLGIEPQGWTSIIVVVLFLGGTQLLILGILGEYIGRIFDEAKGRPNYILARSKNIDLERNR
jgi:dolichol-phosphate mannosyltransferase